MTKAFAPAKINLTLHVTGQRSDGYHLLDSLVVFVDVGDWLDFVPSDKLTLRVSGPHAAGVPVDDSNLVLRAARMLHPTKGAAITLQKNLPVASGIGGGSSDAAAALRGLAALWCKAMPSDISRLGADVPVCLRAKPTRMSGIGEVLDDVPPIPECWLVLVNPGVGVATPAVFNRLSTNTNPPMPKALPKVPTVREFAHWLREMRNDLEAPAIGLEPVIKEVLTALHTQDSCHLARMSGSGATCWGLFATADLAESAAQIISKQHPDWWVQPAKVTQPS